MKSLSSLINTHWNEIKTKDIDLLTNFKGTSSFFYGRPKFHKHQIINETIKTNHQIIMYMLQIQRI